MEQIPIYFERNGLPYEVRLVSFSDGITPMFRVNIYGRFIGNLVLTDEGWQMENGRLQHLAWFFGDHINRFYE